MRKSINWGLLCCALWMPTQGAFAVDSSLSELSAEVSTHLSGDLLYVSTQAARVSGGFVIVSALHTSEVIELTLKHVEQGSKAVLEVSSEVAKELSLVTGASLLASAEASGTLFTQAGKVVAFIPNELGQALTHHSQYAAAEMPIEETEDEENY